MKNFIGKINKKLVFVGTTALTVITGTVASFAADSVDISGVLGDGITNVQTIAMDSIGSIAPVAIGIAGSVIGVKLAIRVFRSVIG